MITQRFPFKNVVQHVQRLLLIRRVQRMVTPKGDQKVILAHLGFLVEMVILACLAFPAPLVLLEYACHALVAEKGFILHSMMSRLEE